MEDVQGTGEDILEVGTYSKDGNEDARSTQHCVVDCLHCLQRVPDAVVITVEAPLVGLDCARFNDEEGQPSWKKGETITKPISNTGKYKQLTKNKQTKQPENPLQTMQHHS